MLGWRRTNLPASMLNRGGAPGGLRINVGLMVIAQGIDSGVSGLTYIIVSRALGPRPVGLWSAILAMVAMVYGCVNLAVHIPVAREIARDPQVAPDYLGPASILVLLGIMPLTVILSVVAGQALGFQGGDLVAVLLAAVTMAVGSLSTLWVSSLQAIGRFDLYLALISLARCTGLLVLVALFRAAPNVLGVLAAGLVSAIVLCVASSWSVIKLFGWISPRWQWRTMRSLASEAWPLTLCSVLAVISLRAPNLILERTRGQGEAGIYSGACTFYMLGVVLSYAATQAIFPALAHAAADVRGERESFVRLFKRSCLIIGGFNLVITAAGALLAPWGLPFVLGAKFSGSIEPLQLLVVGLLFVGLNRLGQQALNASNRQTTTLGVNLLAGGFSVAANLYLIPHYGYMAASATTVAAEALMAAVAVPLALSPKRKPGEEQLPGAKPG